MSDTFVYFRCVTCGWRVDIAPSYIEMVGWLPRALFIPYHECDGGADVEERGGIDGELVTTRPAHNFIIKL